jgi:hypothetical protein
MFSQPLLHILRPMNHHVLKNCSPFYISNRCRNLALTIAFLGYRVFGLEAQVKQLQTNAAFAVLSAEAANNKVGAIAPFFGQDKEAFAKAWCDSVNIDMPATEFPDEVLVPLMRTLEERRASMELQLQKAAIFKCTAWVKRR